MQEIGLIDLIEYMLVNVLLEYLDLVTVLLEYINCSFMKFFQNANVMLE